MLGIKRKEIFSYIRIWTRIGSQFFILLLIEKEKELKKKEEKHSPLKLG